MSKVFSIAKKELKAYFGSPMAAIFIGAFLVCSLFSFFWLETFFARDIADLRPLFRWMPLLMIFLAASLTMRQWSEEQKMGTLEILLTMPVRISSLVFGKFLAVLALVGVALALTLGLPVTVSMMGNVDWGPVMGGYLGALLMASAYIAVGLFISSRTDNQIVALILTVFISGLFYLLGSPDITGFMGNAAGEFFRALGTGSRFQSVARGVLDLRDMVYYGSLTFFFLILNIVSLDSMRWSSGKSTARYRRNVKFGVLLVGINLLALNIWLSPVHSMRLDLTQNRDYSISQTSRDLISNLREPLVLRGYFSEKTHPLLAPLVPRIKDFMEEYEIASGGKVRVSFVDPKYDEQAEAEANQQYGIKPVPFQVTGRYEAAVVNSYFNILVKYGDQYVTLGFNDLIDVHQRKDGQLEVGLRNLEYDLTKSIKKVVYGFKSPAELFATTKKKLELTAVLTPAILPAPFAGVPGHLQKAADELIAESGNKLNFTMINPDDPRSGLSREAVDRKFGIKPLSISFYSNKPFYLHLFLSVGEKRERVYLSGDMGTVQIRQQIEGALKRMTSGFLKTVGLWEPAGVPSMEMMQPHGQQQYQMFKKMLQENYNVEDVDLSSGKISGNIDVLLLLAPNKMTVLDRLAVDQYLMEGGSVVAAAGNYLLDIGSGAQALGVKKVENGITGMLAHYGVKVDDALVMDEQNEPFPVPVNRDLGNGLVIREIRKLNYPFFVDVRADGMDKNNPVLANLPAVTMNWVSPLEVDADKTKGHKVETLLHSSNASWKHTGVDIQPDFEHYPQVGFPVSEKLASYPLAVAVQGTFSSFFNELPDPRINKKNNHSGKTKDEKPSGPMSPLVKQSPESSRLVVIGSAEFASDTVIGISRSMGEDRFLNNLQFLQNAIDWTVEDEGLLSIRSRGSQARLLAPMSRHEEQFWEWLNYGIALLALLLVSVYGARRRYREKPMELDRMTV